MDSQTSSKELGVDYLIEGGQTMNPSTEDMLNAIDKVNAKAIYILPNNKNIILAANQARDLTEDKEDHRCSDQDGSTGSYCSHQLRSGEISRGKHRRDDRGDRKSQDWPDHLCSQRYQDRG